MSSENSDTRRKILLACWTLMVENAGNGVRMSDIAKAAGVSRQALYLHFKTRADLFIATTRFVDNELNSDARLAEIFKTPDPVEKIKIFVAAWAGHMEDIQGVARALLNMSPTDSEALEAWNERMGALHNLCKTITKGLEADGRLNPNITASRAADLFAVTISFQNWDRLRHHFGWSKKAYIEHITALVLSGLVRE